MTIQQAIKGSKLKTNATTCTVAVKFGEWTKKLEANVAGLAGYDAIIGVPMLTDGDAVIDVLAQTVHFRARDFGTLHCELPVVPPKPPKKSVRWMDGQKAKKKGKMDSWTKGGRMEQSRNVANGNISPPSLSKRCCDNRLSLWQ